mgnify:CR=1 FL=1
MIAKVEENKIIVETFVFPGNSGGPIVYVPVIKLGKSFTSLLINEEKLVGIIASIFPIKKLQLAHRQVVHALFLKKTLVSQKLFQLKL